MPSPSPAYPGTYAGTPTPDPTPDGHGEGRSVEAYTVRPGDTLSLIASVVGCTVEEIIAANNLSSADSISVGQTLRIPTRAALTGPALKLVPDSEMVYGPAYVDFDLEGFVRGQGGYLADYTDQVEGLERTGAEVVQLVAQRFSVGPRVLLALLELKSGWVTQGQPAGETLVYPMGHVQAYQEGLFHQLSWAAVRLNEGYYGWKSGDLGTVLLWDGSRVAVAPELNAGTVGIQHCLAQTAAGWDEWVATAGQGGFPAAYERLFGNPFAYSVEPLVPADLEQPELRLPWEAGEVWYLTGGPHGGWGDGSGMAALDFVPAGRHGCAPAPDWVTAAAPGLVVRSENGEVMIDLDGDGFEQTGWVLLYLHIYREGRVEEGTWLEQGERIGRPSCEGGYSEATHLHFARRYNGEWIPAGSGAAPMVLSGWTAHEGARPYSGTMTRGGEERRACECWEDEVNGLVSDNPAP
ncbi:MAG: LysM peptidoglycan-binding domain-containing protein [Chloroflexota bacterium]